MKAIISVYDKSDLIEFASTLHHAGVELISTGGTGSILQGASLPMTHVSALTGFSEILDGRVKTLHPKIYGGLLARRDRQEHMAEIQAQGICPIDIVVVNLYPFVQTVNKPNVSQEKALDNIDIGGPSMLRAAAKNFPFVIPIVDPSDYSWVGKKIIGTGLSQEERRSLASKAFKHVSNYDSAIAEYLCDSLKGSLPPTYELSVQKIYDLHYGENPHQTAALYGIPSSKGGVAHAKQLHGPELSFNNLLDVDAAWQTVNDFDATTVTIIKHTNPCGLASHPDLTKAYNLAIAGDPVSAYGGIVGFNRTVTLDVAKSMKGTLHHAVVAPNYEPEALKVLQKRRSLRVLAADTSPEHSYQYDLRSISGGALLQTRDEITEDPSSWKAVTKRKPTQEELDSLIFAWKAVKHIKSNAIVLARGKTLIGMGAGQPNRVTSTRIAIKLAGDKSVGSVIASDAFLPFSDNVDVAGSAGVTAIIQPGGSIRDQECIEAANNYRMAMLFTKSRHFKH